jgi:IclR family KDG regulon transcriptional repressor
MPERGHYKIKVLEKALAIVELFDQPGIELTATGVAKKLGMSKATAFRILSVLEARSYLERARDGGAYRLGFMLHRLGSLVEGRAVIQRRARAVLEELKHECDETVHLVVLDAGEALYLDKIEGRKAIRVVSRVGMRLPLHCSGVGKVLLAYLSDDQIDEIIRLKGLAPLTPNTITERAALRAELRLVRRKGFAVDNEEIELGLKCVAAPVRDASGAVVAAVSISGPKYRFDNATTRELVRLLCRAGDRISSALGHEGASTRSDGKGDRRSRNARLDGAFTKRLASG